MAKYRVGPLCFGYFPNDERCWLPRFGVLNTHAEDAIASFWLAEDGKLEVYVYWIMFEVAIRLKTRRAQGIRGYVKGEHKCSAFHVKATEATDRAATGGGVMNRSILFAFTFALFGVAAFDRFAMNDRTAFLVEWTGAVILLAISSAIRDRNPNDGDTDERDEGSVARHAEGSNQTS